MLNCIPNIKIINRRKKKREKGRKVLSLYLKNKRKVKRKKLTLQHQGPEVSVRINDSSIQILHEYFDKPTEKRS